MKHIISCIMALFLLTGCSTIGNSSTVNFYYPRAEFEYNSADGVIDSEVRDNGSNASTSSLLSLYLKGPLEIRFSTRCQTNSCVVSLLASSCKSSINTTSAFSTVLLLSPFVCIYTYRTLASDRSPSNAIFCCSAWFPLASYTQ